MSADGSLPTMHADPRSAGLQSIRVVQDFIPVLDTGRFEHMQRIASVMAETSMIPDALRLDAERNELPLRKVIANCFLVVNQATRWGMDPFAVAQCVSLVHGKLTYEGKLVAAVLDAKLGVRLRYEYKGQGETMSVVVSGMLPDGCIEEITGTVAQWKTNGKNSPWFPDNYRKMLAYRGAREWARIHAPAVMLGVYAPDEMDDLRRDRPMIDVTPRAAPPAAPRLGGEPPHAPPAAQPSVLPARAGPPPAPKGPPRPPPVAAKPAAEPTSEADVLAELEQDLGACGDEDTLNEVWVRFEGQSDTISRGGRDAAATLYERELKRLQG